MLFNIKQYDIFISYVVEDRETVEALCKGLTDRKLRVWYAKQQLYPGADIVEVIKSGLRNVRYGILLISPLYHGHWSGAETFALMDNRKRLIPILYNITLEKAVVKIPGLSNIYCLNANEGIELVIDQVCKRIKPKNRLYYITADAFQYINRNSRIALGVSGTLLLFLLAIALSWYYNSIGPSSEFVEKTIKHRQYTVETLAKKEFEDNLATHDYTVSSINELQHLTPNSNRKLVFYNGIDYIHSAAGLKNEGIIPTVEPVEPPFGLAEYKAYLFKNNDTGSSSIKYALINLIPQQYEITDARLDNDIYEVDVHYTSAIRYIGVNVYADTINRPSFVAHFLGTKPNETYVFEKSEADWVLLLIR